MPPSRGQYEHEHTKRWAAIVASYDAFVFVTPEYNHGPSAALKNALDFVMPEWANKACAFVGYGSLGAARAVAQLRTIVGELAMADVRLSVALLMAHDWEKFTVFKFAESHATRAMAMLDQLVAWGAALKPLW